MSLPIAIPTITVSDGPGNVPVNETESVTFTCEADGEPIPSFQWEKVGTGNIISDGTKYTIDNSTPGRSTLTVNDAEPSDVGNYTCTATNVHGSSISPQVHLEVYSKS